MPDSSQTQLVHASEHPLRARLQEAGAKLPVASPTYKPGEEPARKGGGKGGKGGKKGA